MKTFSECLLLVETEAGIISRRFSERCWRRFTDPDIGCWRISACGRFGQFVRPAAVSARDPSCLNFRSTLSAATVVTGDRRKRYAKRISGTLRAHS